MGFEFHLLMIHCHSRLFQVLWKDNYQPIPASVDKVLNRKYKKEWVYLKSKIQREQKNSQ